MDKSMIINMLLYIFTVIRICFNYAVDYIANLYWKSEMQVVPDINRDHKFLFESATSLARKIRMRTLKSEDLVKACIERIKEVNPVINAVTDQRYEEAIQEAKAVDQIIMAGVDQNIFKSKPYLGVPFSAKESFDVKGMRNSLGLKSRINLKASEDAEVVRLMKEAGGILVVITNVPEVNRWQETYNMVNGLTCNPYDSTRTVGGSSGGEASLVSSSGSPFGLCSDIGGSTRMPAFYCGSFGHNPTAGIVNMRGASLRTGKELNSMVSAGVITRHAEDLAPLMRILAAENANSLNIDDKPFDINSLKVYYIEEIKDLRCSPINAELQVALKKVVKVLSEMSGNKAILLSAPNLKYSSVLWRYWMMQEPADFAHLLANKVGRVNGIVELFKKLLGLSEFTFASILSLLDEQFIPAPPSQWAEATTKQLKEEIVSKLGSDGVLICPSAPRCAPHHYTAYTRLWDFTYWSTWNSMRFPATQVPLGLNSSGLPLGVQVVAAPHNDGLAIKVAEYLEKQFGGFVPPCKVHA